MAPTESTHGRPTIRGIRVPVEADSVDSPIVTYGDGPASISFMTSDRRWARTTFEKLDSIRVSRGEYEPYLSKWKPPEPSYWVSVVHPSPWLRERYEYEKAHYGNWYDAEEMTRDFSHYLFKFHDEFVEALSAGIWFETDDQPIGNRALGASHPLLDLPSLPEPERFEAHGITCQIRRSQRPLTEILRDAELCSQNLLQFAAELDGSARVDWTLSVRARDGKVQSTFAQHFARGADKYDGVATLDDVRPRVEAWLAEVSERRRQKGSRA